MYTITTDNPHLYRGGGCVCPQTLVKFMNKKYTKYLSSRVWAKLRKRIIRKRGCKCERCGSQKMLQVHHKTYKNVFKEKDKDLEVLCRGCHMREHGIKINPYWTNPIALDVVDIHSHKEGRCDICDKRRSWFGHYYIIGDESVIMACKHHFPKWIKRCTTYNAIYLRTGQKEKLQQPVA